MKNRIDKLRGLAAEVLVVAATAAFISQASAHHSPASFNTKETITINGVVTKIDWFNPHVYVHVEETTEAGKKVDWEIECFPPMALRGLGWLKDTVRVGDTLTVSGNAAKDSNSKEIFPIVIKRGDRILFAMQDAARKLYSADNAPKATTKTNTLNGVWETVVSMPVLMLIGNSRSSPLTEAGKEALNHFDEKNSPANHCIPSPAPTWMVIPDIKRITVGEEAIYFEGEYDGGRRTIHLNAASHTGAIPSFQGHSIGKWEGKTLVVDTTHFAYHGMGNGGGNGLAPDLPSSTQKHLFEHFIPSEDGKSLTYQFELHDPVYLATPRKAKVQWIYSPAAKFETVPCNLDSARRFIKY